MIGKGYGQWCQVSHIIFPFSWVLGLVWDDYSIVNFCWSEAEPTPSNFLVTRNWTFVLGSGPKFFGSKKHPERMEMNGPKWPITTQLQDEAFVSNGRRVALQRAAGIWICDGDGWESKPWDCLKTSLVKPEVALVGILMNTTHVRVWLLYFFAPLRDTWMFVKSILFWRSFNKNALRDLQDPTLQWFKSTALDGHVPKSGVLNDHTSKVWVGGLMWKVGCMIWLELIIT